MDDTLAPKERILLAAIDCINDEGPQGATIRRIAERAKVNQAAISYYYQGKDNLLRLAMETTLSNAFDLKDFAASAEAGPRERLVHILDGLVEGTLRYPGIARVHFYDALTESRYDGPAIQRFNAFMDELNADVSARYRQRGEVPEDLREALVAAVAATVLFAATLPEVFGAFGGLDLRQPDARRHYVARVVEGLFPSPG